APNTRYAHNRWPMAKCRSPFAPHRPAAGTTPTALRPRYTLRPPQSKHPPEGGFFVTGRSAYRPDISLMAARISSSEQSLQVPFGGMAFRPAIALLTRPSSPPLASARACQAAVSWFFGESSRPLPGHAVQSLGTTSAPLRAAPPAAAATAPTPLHS